MSSTNENKTPPKQEKVPVPAPITISLRDFKQWLIGVEDMQGEDWAPTAEQWKKIRQKIELISDAPSQQPHYSSPAFGNHPTGAVPRTTLPITEQSSSIAAPVVRKNPPLSPAMIPGNGPNNSPKTPDIDTSTTPYTPDRFI